MGSLWNFSSTNHEHDLTTLNIHMVVIPIFGMTHLIAIIVFVSKLVGIIIVFREVGLNWSTIIIAVSNALSD